MADDLLWREEKDLRPRTPEDVKDAPYAWPGEKVFAPDNSPDPRRFYNDDNRTPMSTRERDELQRHRFVTGALRRTICAPPHVTMRLGIETTITRWCSGDCRECLRGETIPNAFRSNWNDGWQASQNLDVIMHNHRNDTAMAALGKVNEVLNRWGYALACADSLQDVKSCDGSNCRAFIAMPHDEFDRRRMLEVDHEGQYLTGNIWD